jgi:hypothetical protein
LSLEYAGGLHIIALREGELGQNSHKQRTNTHPQMPTPFAREHRAELLHFYIYAKKYVSYDQLDQLQTIERPGA